MTTENPQLPQTLAEAPDGRVGSGPSLGCFFGLHAWGSEEHRRQTCKRCGKIKILPCGHEWEDVHTLQAKYVFGGGQAVRIYQRCRHCGEGRRVDLA